MSLIPAQKVDSFTCPPLCVGKRLSTLRLQSKMPPAPRAPSSHGRSRSQDSPAPEPQLFRVFQVPASRVSESGSQSLAPRVQLPGSGSQGPAPMVQLPGSSSQGSSSQGSSSQGPAPRVQLPRTPGPTPSSPDLVQSPCPPPQVPGPPGPNISLVTGPPGPKVPSSLGSRVPQVPASARSQCPQLRRSSGPKVLSSQVPEVPRPPAPKVPGVQGLPGPRHPQPPTPSSPDLMQSPSVPPSSVSLSLSFSWISSVRFFFIKDAQSVASFSVCSSSDVVAMVTKLRGKCLLECIKLMVLNPVDTL